MCGLNFCSKCSCAFRDLGEELSKIRDNIQKDAMIKLEERNIMQKKALDMFGNSSSQGDC